jgi:hypothetical protein
LDGIKVLGSRPVDSGAATLTVNSFDHGGHNIIARYDGDNNNYGSLSATTQVVKPLPVAGNDTFKLVHMGLGSVTEAAPGVLGNDNDAEGRVLTVVGTTASSPKIITLTNPKGIVSGGTVALYADGQFDYTPANIGFNGTRSFTYQATNGKANSDPATVTLVIKRAPYAGNDSSTTSQGKPVTINLIANDVAYKATINPSAITIVSPPENGNATVNPNGIVVYKPNANFGGTDIFTYTVNDSTGATSNIATVTVYVPKAVADNYKVTATTGASQKTSKNTETGVLANDQPIELKGRTVRVVGDITRTGGKGTATIGSLTLNANGSFNFTLTAPASATTAGLKKDSKRGTYKFSYKETLNGVTTAPTTTTIEVQ